jgi:hypothetical protein
MIREFMKELIVFLYNWGSIVFPILITTLFIIYNEKNEKK